MALRKDWHIFFSVKIPTLWIFKGFFLRLSWIFAVLIFNYFCFWGLFQVFFQHITTTYHTHTHTWSKQCYGWPKFARIQEPSLKTVFVLEFIFPLLHERSWYYSQAHDMNDPSATETEEASNLLRQNLCKKPLDCNRRLCKCFLLECSEPTEIWIVTRWWKSINLLGKVPFKSQPWCFKYWTYVCPFHSHQHW